MNHRGEPEPGVLYLVGTPIGHMGELSQRAKDLLKKVSYIACEDTRHSGQLLKNLDAKGQRLSFHQHNTQSMLPKLLELLKEKKTLAIISDAGLPGISDPGEELVSAARDDGYDVICISGPCAATTALISSGLPSSRFCFEGFLPTKGKERKQRLLDISNETRTTILYEAPHRLIQLLDELIKLCGSERPIQVARELTKRHEEQIGSTISQAKQHFELNKPLGEFTLVLGGAQPKVIQEKTDQEWLKALKELIASGMSASEASRQLAKETSHSKRYLYDLLHKEINEESN